MLGSCYVTRPVGDGGNLNIQNPGTYQLIEPGPGPGALSWRRMEATSPYVHGSVLVNAVKDTMTLPLSILVEGTTMNALMSRTATLLRAFEQFSYSVHLTFGGEAFEFVCQPADYTAQGGEGVFDLLWLCAYKQVYNFKVPRNPTPTSGAF